MADGQPFADLIPQLNCLSFVVSTIKRIAQGESFL